MHHIPPRLSLRVKTHKSPQYLQSTANSGAPLTLYYVAFFKVFESHIVIFKVEIDIFFCFAQCTGYKIVTPSAFSLATCSLESLQDFWLFWDCCSLNILISPQLL